MEKEITTFLAVETFIQEHAIEVRGERILPDVDVAKLYEVSIAEVHKTVAREKERFTPLIWVCTPNLSKLQPAGCTSDHCPEGQMNPSENKKARRL